MTAIETDSAAETVEEPQKRLSGKKVILFVVLPVALLIAVGAGLYFSGILKPAEGHKDEHAAEPEEEEHFDPHAPPVFVNLPTQVVNLASGGPKQSFLKLQLTLQMQNAEQQKELDKVMPRINEVLTIYLREMRSDDFRTSGDIGRLREELLMRINAATAPMKIRDVLIKEFLPQ
jgi:flagellar protein FliL